MSFSKKSKLPDKDFRIVPEKYIPEVESELRKKPVLMPDAIYNCSGIRVLGNRIKSFIFSTDIAIIKNSNAQAVMAVYPFTPQLSIIQAILQAVSVPVFAGVGGGTTTGQRCVNIAIQAEHLGAYGVVVNAPIQNEVIEELYSVLDIPVVATVVTEYDDIIGKINAGARILNVSGGKNTPKLIKHIRNVIGDEFPIIGTGGDCEKHILQTIDAGANSITYTPPTNSELFKDMMIDYRKEAAKRGLDLDEEALDLDESFQQDLVFPKDSIEVIDEDNNDKD